MSRMRTLAAAAGVAATALIAVAGISVAAGPPDKVQAAPAATSGGVKTAYFTQWGIYANGFYPKNMITTGMASKLDFLNYAFANIHPTTSKPFVPSRKNPPFEEAFQQVAAPDNQSN